MKKINIVFIHGLLANKDSNITLKKYCDQNNFNYYSLDLPGHGKEPFNNIALNLDAYIDFVLNFINSNNIERPILVGHSFGGAIVVGLISKMKKKEKYLAILEDPINQSVLEKSENGKIDDYVFDVDLFIKKIKIISKYRLKDLKNVTLLLKNSTNEKSLTTLNNYYKNVDIPTLIIFGKKDRIINQEKSFENIKKLNKSIQFSVIKEARHTPHIEDPEDYIKSLNSFLLENKVFD